MEVPMSTRTRGESGNSRRHPIRVLTGFWGGALRTCENAPPATLETRSSKRWVNRLRRMHRAPLEVIIRKESIERGGSSWCHPSLQ